MCSKETRADIARRYGEVLRACASAGVRVEDWRNVQIYDDIMRLRRDGLKMEYCVNYASEQYAISTARVWRLLRHMKARV